MSGWEPACETITRRSGLPRNAHLHAHIYREVAQFLKTTDFVDFDLHRSDGQHHGASGVKLYPGSANAHDRRNGVPGVQ